MTISTVIPCHNAGRWIESCLRSVAQQRHRAHEIILVNDNSSDDSVERAAASGVPVRLLNVSVRNAAAARNEGIEVATGDWIAFLDADTEWAPYHLSQAVELLRGSDAKVYMVYQGDRADDGTLTCDLRTRPIPKPRNDLTAQDFLKWRYEHGYGFATCGLIARRDAVNEVGRFDVTQLRRHDLELFTRLVSSNTWAFHPNPSWHTAPARPGDISADRAKCRYFAARCFLKNEHRFTNGLIGDLIRKEARKAMLEAIRTGTADDRARAHELVASRLSTFDRAAFAVLRAAAVFR